MAEKVETFLEKTTKELLGHLEVKAEAKVSKKEDLITIQLQTEEPGLLIGYHGQTLDSLQRLLSLMVYHQKGEWIRLLVNVNDYRQKRQIILEKMALSVAQKVKFSGESQTLLPMSSFERRIIHLALAKDPEVETDSEGEGGQRRVVVRPGGREEKNRVSDKQKKRAEIKESV